MKNVLKTLAYMIAFGVRSVMRLFVTRPEVVVLMYHAVDDSGWKHAIPPADFWQHITYLQKHRVIVPLVDVVAHARGKETLKKDSVALTFDDGYYELMRILPRLLEKGIPFTLFVPSDMSVPTNPAKSRRMSWDDILTFAGNPLVTIAAHGRTHRKLTHVPAKDLSQEIRGCADAIEASTGKRSEYFAYPYGDKNAEIVRAVRDAGYTAACAITEGLVRPGDDLYTLKRIQVDRTMNFILFRTRLTRAVEVVGNMNYFKR